MKSSYPPDYYSQLLKRQVDEKVISIINQDVHRTYPDNARFKLEEEKLRRILSAYSVHNPYVIPLHRDILSLITPHRLVTHNP